MVLVLKVYFHHLRGVKCEIRRVSTTSDFLSSYNMLCCKIVSLFPFLEGQLYTLSWKDDEGDEVVMSTDQELDQAVSNATNNILKIHVKLIADGNSMPGSSCTEIVHSNVVCDSCNEVVRGHRYKCLQCEDFDLCNSCNALDKHPFHDMVKLVSPSSTSRAWFFRGWRSLWHSMFGHEVHRSCSHNPHWHHGSKKNKGRGGAKCPWVASPVNKEALNLFGQSISLLLSPFGVDATVDVVVDKENKSSSQPDQAPTSETAECSSIPSNEEGAGAKESASADGPPLKVRKEQEETAAAAPEPAASSENDSEPVKIIESSSGSPSAEPSTSQAAGDDHSKAGPSRSRPIILPDPAKFLSAVSKVIAATQYNSPEGGKPKGLFAHLEEAARTIDDWTILNAPTQAEDKEPPQMQSPQTEPPQMQSPQMEPPQMQSPQTEPPQTEPKVVNENTNMKPEGHTHESRNGSTDSAEIIYPSKSVDARILAALHYMLAMGFSNDGDLLLKLLEEKNGNINEVLDALYRK